MRNTVRLNISSPELMASEGLSWVLRRQQIRTERWPRMGEAVRVLTAPTGFARHLLTYRDFHLLDETDKTIATATSEWLLIDVKRRRPRPLPSRIAQLAESLAPASAHLTRPTGKLAVPKTPTLSTESQVAYYQLDFNDHLTNPCFPELMLEPLGHQFLTTHTLQRVDISFVKEARYGDHVTAVCETLQNGCFAHGLLGKTATLATMHTKWKQED